ncbi:DUF4276 family protein [Flectobacillus sp. BAB-3569]|uniref:DUF4276 family protein n=1 Tax=Flectobacillus sp. BAB-3569 TaxID=1509483 RepID=UPI000BA2CBF3|nr:DUF4276 family protein [Flectobacillus sp. BAB-3569]PAC31412.1 hypothetical protein BWI92_08740 [Flectobacillus sp. BAB-3569]
MVEVSILVEGGVHPNSNASADTFDNSEKLRESFQSLLSKGVQDDRIQIKIDTKGSYASIIKMPLHSNQLALLDLDGDQSQKTVRLKEYQLEQHQDFVFFMIQAMESWILSQPDKIETTFEAYTKIIDGSLAEFQALKDMSPEDISNPSGVLNSLLQSYFESEKAGKIKKLKYGKLKNSHLLIQQLDPEKLKYQFEDFHYLLNKIKELLIHA